MKQMQNFHKRMLLNDTSPNFHERCLKALTRLNRDQVNSSAVFEPWFTWGSETSTEAG